MNDIQVPQAERVVAAPPPPRRTDPLRRWTLVVLVLCVLLFGWTLIADRLTPYTSDASVRSFVVRMVPEVSGKVVEVAVRDNQIVHLGDLLYQIDQTPFRIAVERAEARLAAAGQAVGASTAAVDAAQAQLVEDTATRTNVRDQAARVFELVRVGVYPRAKGDQARGELDAAEAQVKQSQAALEQARQALGPKGADNPQIREALAALEQARLDLSRTTLRAPGDGVVTNRQLTVGQFATAGQPALTFLDARLVWLNAFLRENSLEYITPGAQAEVVLDVLPGRVLPARVESLGWGVSEGDMDAATGLPKARQGSGGWLAPAQRFPVRLAFETAGGPPDGVRYNARASVIVYTGEHPVANALAWFWIRLIAVLTYVS
jgi:multidrug resistance efflux pump